MRKLRFLISAMAMAGVGFASASTGLGQTTNESGPAKDGGSSAVQVEIVEFTFQTDTVRVTPGTVVRWINRDQVAHTSTAEDGAWKSPLLGPGETFEQKFEEVGEYPYYCTPHPFMRGVVIVSS